MPYVCICHNHRLGLNKLELINDVRGAKASLTLNEVYLLNVKLESLI